MLTLPSRRQLLVALMAAAAVGVAALYVTRPQVPSSTVAAPGSSDPLTSGEIQTILEPDAIQAVDKPSFATVGQTQSPDSTAIIGVANGAEAHAFPIAFMSRVEIVNDRLGGGNIAVTW